MKLERLHEYILPTVATLAGMGFAIYCARLTGYGQMGTLALMLGAVVVVALTLIMRQAIWMFIPVFWAFHGQIPILPLPFAVRDLVIMGVFGAFLAFKALKIVRRKPVYSLVDFVMFGMVVYLVTVFIRNPVGVSALGSEKVGGRPYFNVFIALVAYVVLARVSLTSLQARILPLFIGLGYAAEGFLSLLTFRFPGLVPVLAPFYSAVSVESYAQEDIYRRNDAETTGRQTHLMIIGQPIATLLVAWFRPLTLINPLYFWRALAFAFTCLMLLLSGFRSSIAAVGGMFLVASYLRRGWIEVARVGFIAAPILGVVLVMQGVVFELPLAAQRALSFLPGRWDYTAIREAHWSTQWRVEMWKTVLTTDKYIENKVLGDGFGFTRRQLEIMAALARFRTSEEDVQENAMISGAVHSGPVSTIRFVGFVGLGGFMLLLLLMAREAIHIVRRAAGTDYYWIAMFVGLPIIWNPVHYTFIFGGFEGAFPDAIVACGMLRMLSNTLESHGSTAPVRTPAARREKPARARKQELVPAI